MENKSLIAIETFCTYHNVDHSFIYTIEEAGLIEIILIDDSCFINEERLNELEKMVRLYKELGVNPEGIGVVLQLLENIEYLQKENDILKKKLGRLGG